VGQDWRIGPCWICSTTRLCLPYHASLKKQGNSEQRKGERKMHMHFAVLLDSDAERDEVVLLKRACVWVMPKMIV
jgi:hypothetical protein